MVTQFFLTLATLVAVQGLYMYITRYENIALDFSEPMYYDEDAGERKAESGTARKRLDNVAKDTGQKTNKKLKETINMKNLEIFLSRFAELGKAELNNALEGMEFRDALEGAINVKQAYKLAQIYDVEGRSKMRKAELVYGVAVAMHGDVAPLLEFFGYEMPKEEQSEEVAAAPLHNEVSEENAELEEAGDVALTLDRTIEIIVVDTTDDMKNIALDIAKDMANTFGGFNMYEGIGGWVDDEGNLVQEKHIRVSANAMALEGHSEAIADMVKKASVNQDAVSLVIDGTLHIIDTNGGDLSGRDMKNIKNFVSGLVDA